MGKVVIIKGRGLSFQIKKATVTVSIIYSLLLMMQYYEKC